MASPHPQSRSPLGFEVTDHVARRPGAWARRAHYEPMPRADDGTRGRAWLLVLFVVSFFFFAQIFSF